MPLLGCAVEACCCATLVLNVLWVSPSNSMEVLAIWRECRIMLEAVISGQQQYFSRCFLVFGACPSHAILCCLGFCSKQSVPHFRSRHSLPTASCPAEVGVLCRAILQARISGARAAFTFNRCFMVWHEHADFFCSTVVCVCVRACGLWWFALSLFYFHFIFFCLSTLKFRLHSSQWQGWSSPATYQCACWLIKAPLQFFLPTHTLSFTHLRCLDVILHTCIVMKTSVKVADTRASFVEASVSRKIATK